VSDCIHADVFIVKEVMASQYPPSQILIPAAPLGLPYLKNAEVGVLASDTFYIRQSQHKNHQGKPILDLYLADLIKNQHEPLLEGVEDLQVTFVRGNAINTTKETANARQGGDWEKVTAVEVGLLVNSTEEVNDKPQRYYFMGKQREAKADHKLRQEWRSYLAIRSRVAPEAHS